MIKSNECIPCKSQLKNHNEVGVNQKPTQNIDLKNGLNALLKPIFAQSKNDGKFCYFSNQP